MKTLLNILWYFPFFGFMSAIGAGLLGVIMCITIVGIPIGLGLLQFSKFLFLPYGNAMVDKKDLEVLSQTDKHTGVYDIFALIVRILYFPFGLISCILMAIQGALCCITIIGIPIGLVIFRSLSTYFNPVNKVCVSETLAKQIELKKAGCDSVPNPYGDGVIPVSSAVGTPELTVSSYSDEKLDVILASPDMYSDAVVSAVTAEKEIRAKASDMMPQVEQFDDAKIADIIANSSTYNPVVVHCARKVNKVRNAELLRKQEEERKAKIEAIKNNIIEAKWYIAGAVALIIIFLIFKHYTSDEYRYEKGYEIMVSARTSDDYIDAAGYFKKMSPNDISLKMAYNCYLLAGDSVAAAQTIVDAIPEIENNPYNLPSLACIRAINQISGELAPIIEKDIEAGYNTLLNSYENNYKYDGAICLIEAGKGDLAQNLLEQVMESSYSQSYPTGGLLAVIYAFGLNGNADVRKAWRYIRNCDIDKYPQFAMLAGDLAMIGGNNYDNIFKANDYYYKALEVVKPELRQIVRKE